MSSKLSFEEFCENHFYASDTCSHPTLHENQFDWLASHDGELLVDYVFKIEEYKKAICEIKELTNGRPLSENVRQHVNPDSYSHNYRDMYNERTKGIIKKRFEKGIDYFGFTC